MTSREKEDRLEALSREVISNSFSEFRSIKVDSGHFQIAPLEKEKPQNISVLRGADRICIYFDLIDKAHSVNENEYFEIINDSHDRIVGFCWKPDQIEEKISDIKKQLVELRKLEEKGAISVKKIDVRKRITSAIYNIISTYKDDNFSEIAM